LSPILALILCLSFVLFLLRFERRRARDVTNALWIPLIWVLYIASKPLGTWFRSSTIIEYGSPLDRAFLIPLMLISLLILIKRKFDWRSAIRENKWLIILVCFMLVSILWSSIPYISFKRWTRELVAILMAFIVLSEASPRRAIEVIFRRMTYILIPFSILLIKYFPIYGRMYNPFTGKETWTGVAQQKNGLGILCVIAGFSLIWSLIKRMQGNNPPFWKYQTPAELFLLALTLYLLRGAESASSNVALAVGMIGYLGFYLMKKKRIRMRSHALATIVTIIIIIGTIAPFTSASFIGSFAGSVGRDSTLTGRTDIWNAILPFVKHRLLLGLGFGGFWTSQTTEAIQVNQSHNGYLELILALGFVGLVLFSIFLLSSCRKAQQNLSSDFDWGVIWACNLVMFVIHNISEASLNDLATFFATMIVFFSVSSKNGAHSEVCNPI